MIRNDILFVIFSIASFQLSAQSFSWGGKGPDAVMDLHTPFHSESVLVTGYFSDTMLLDSATYVSEGSRNAYLFIIFPYYYMGTFFLGVAYSPGYSSGMAVTSDKKMQPWGNYWSNLYWAGIYTDSLTLEDQVLSSYDSGTDIFLAKINMDPGKLLWVAGISGPGDDVVYGLAQHNDTIFLAGEFNDSLFAGSDTLISAGGKDAMIIMIDNNGSILQSMHFGGIGDDQIFSIAKSRDTQIYVCGYFSDTINFDTIQLISAGGKDIFLLKLDKLLHPVWALQWGGPNDDIPSRVGEAEQNRVCISGHYSDSLTSYPGALQSAGAGDNGLMAIVNPDASVYWQKTLRGPGNNYISDIMFWSDHYIITGQIDSVAMLGTTSIPDIDNDIYMFAIGKNASVVLDEYNYHIFKGNGNNTMSRLAFTDIYEFGIVLSGQFTDTLRLFNDYFNPPNPLYLENYNASPDCFISGDLLAVNGIIDLASVGEMEIYPNPAQDLIHIQVPSYSTPIKLLVFNTLGNLLLSKPIDSGSDILTLSFNDFSRGMYILQLQTKKKIFTGKLILD